MHVAEDAEACRIPEQGDTIRVHLLPPRDHLQHGISYLGVISRSSSPAITKIHISDQVDLQDLRKLNHFLRMHQLFQHENTLNICEIQNLHNRMFEIQLHTKKSDTVENEGGTEGGMHSFRSRVHSVESAKCPLTVSKIYCESHFSKIPAGTAAL